MNQSAQSTEVIAINRSSTHLIDDWLRALKEDDVADAASDKSRVSVQIKLSNDDTLTSTIQLHSTGRVPSLSHILPALHNAGVTIDREQTFPVSEKNGTRQFVTCLTFDKQSAAKMKRPDILTAAQELFTALINDEAEDGRLNGLVIEAGLSIREVQLVRAYLTYWRQTGSKFSVRYMADCLRRHAGVVKQLVDAFSLRFNPALSEEQRAAGTQNILMIKARVPTIDHADGEQILLALADLMLATLRTNYFQNNQQGDKIILKFDISQLAMVPAPRPYREIFVFSRRFEGLHLRGGPVARGGLRWSDRMEDYRTEVLGLVKAQMVKNAVIVPAGAKGGFVCKMMPKYATREAVAAEGQAVYRQFITSLLEVTDNREYGMIMPPPDTVRYDQDDPYLVVAADKGTATFSDIANEIAVKRGFWLGDAFASGGSNGYDHKKLGITAKGAFEAVRRHFYEQDIDIGQTSITLIGVGDMSGDVFGNGLLLSRRLKLIAAFDHRHIFIDPDPDVATSFAERARLFALPRSSWDDYDRTAISNGGGIYLRSARSIGLSPDACAALDIAEQSLTPEQLIRRILLAPVDLFYNGGIGTYIKASHETHEQVKDRANDAIRVDGNELRCKVVTEGGNLGVTQSGRIEFALAGGRIFTDAIDNSAGVDCSDHEVNVKIWLDAEVNAGTLSQEDRNGILHHIAPDIETLVLRDNMRQTRLLVREWQAQTESAVVDAYASLITEMEADGTLSRTLDQLPTDAELQRRKEEGIGLTMPELAVVIANVKNRFKRILPAMHLLDFSWAESILTPYFPPALVAGRRAISHPLANAILATVLANEAINRCGPLMIRSLAIGHRVREADVLCAWGQAWSALCLAPLFDALDCIALNVPRAVSVNVDARSRILLESLLDHVLALPPGQQCNVHDLLELSESFANLCSVGND